MEFKDRLIYAMDQKKVKQIELSNRTGLAPGTISNYMQGKYKAKGENLRKLAYAHLTGWDGRAPPECIRETHDKLGLRGALPKGRASRPIGQPARFARLNLASAPPNVQLACGLAALPKDFDFGLGVCGLQPRKACFDTLAIS